MSIAVMSAIWEHSECKGSELLVMLALADFATDDGRSWPSVERLAKKTRLSERNVRYVLRQLEETGVIATLSQGAKNGCNLYRILPPANFAPLQPSVDRGATQRIEGGQHVAPEPSLDPLEIRQSPPARARKPSVIPLTEEERKTLRGEFPDLPDVQEQIDLAASHENAKKYPTNQLGYTRNWLRRERGWRAERRSNGSNGYQSRGSAQPQLPRPSTAPGPGRAPDLVV